MRIMEQYRYPLYDEILEEHNLLEEVVIQFVNEIRYKNCGPFKYFQYSCM
jgi:hypothetical protein